MIANVMMQLPPSAPDAVLHLIQSGWQGILTILVLRWLYMEMRGKKNGNPHNNPGNHSAFEARLDRIEKTQALDGEAISRIDRHVSRLEGRLNGRPKAG